MALAEAFIVELGAGIGKALLKAWLRDGAILADVSGSLVDILKSTSLTRLAQHEAAYKLEKVGQKVARSLLPLFAAEGSRVDEAEQTAVILASSETLAAVQITPDLLLDLDLNPDKLTKYALDLRPNATRDLSESGPALYRRLMVECVISIGKIASKLPAFTERAFAELLERDRRLAELIEDVLVEVRRLRSRAVRDDPEAVAALYQEEYRTVIARVLDELELYGVDLSETSQRQPLTEAYVSLRSVPRSLAQNSFASVALDEFDKPPEGPPSGAVNTPLESPDTAGRTEASAQPVEQLLASTRRLVLIGPAGCGKTTFLQWVAVRCASRDFVAELESWNDQVPFFLRLRRLNDAELPSPRDFPKLAAGAIGATAPDLWAHEVLKAGRAVVLVDGLDEVSNERRDRIREWLQDLVVTYPDARYIVTSRPHAITADWMSAYHFGHAELLPLSVSVIPDFVDRWHAAVRERARDQDAELSRALAEHLKDVLRHNTALNSLATSPLLCALICALHRDRRAELPDGRIRLYEACCEMLIERRDRERGIKSPLTYDQKLLVLEDFAYWLLENDSSEIDIDDADAQFNRRLSTIADLPTGITGADVRKVFVERTSLIREPVAQRLDFAHRSFQEFLAAKAALDRGNIGVLIRNAHEHQWREVVILASGRANPIERRKLIAGLLSRGNRAPRLRHQLHLMAAACLKMSVDRDPEVAARVDQCVAALVPPKNADEARSIGGAGDLAVPHLIAPREDEDIAVACVRALAHIATPLALTTLAAYAEDERINVRTVLCTVWESFDAAEYGRQVIRRMAADRDQLVLPSAPTLSGLDSLQHLKSLTIEDSGNISDLSPLIQLGELETLVLEWSAVRTYIVSKTVSLPRGWSSGISDLGLLTGLMQLRHLSLAHCVGVNDLTPLGSMEGLRNLTLRQCANLSDLGPLSAHLALETLRISGLAPDVDLTPLGGLTNLRILRLDATVSGEARYGDWRRLDYPWYQSVEMERFMFSYGQTVGLDQLDSLTVYISDLRTSRGTGRGKTTTDLRFLRELNRLETLELSGFVGIEDLTAITGLTRLSALSLDSCIGISDLRPLAVLGGLTSLSIRGCSGVNDLRPLAQLAELRSLDVTGCFGVRDYGPVSLLSKLEFVHGQAENEALLKQVEELRETGLRLERHRG
jgi:Leucine-rich repeat (LRR) protein